ncbi:hypothetical protein [Halorubrum sp. SY-15]|uniref:hypothetical protein n=1 Tax=Halorubrum sp. SY-15 TaxID=3402277 RepID=UPI003EBE54D4
MRGTRVQTPITRRRVLTGGGVTAAVSLAGCAGVIDAIGEQIFEDVNVLNQLSRTVSGSIRVVDPSDETVLDGAFEVPSTEADGASNLVAYGDVWTNPGTYRVRIDLTDIVLEGVSRVTRAVAINDPAAEMVAVSIGARDGTEPIAISVGESFSDVGPQNTTT